MLPKTSIYQKPHIGISIENTGIRAIFIDQSGKVVSQTEVPFPTNSTLEPWQQPEIITQALTSLTQSGHYPTNLAAVCIPEKLTYSRLHNLPVLPLTEVTEAINWQLDNIFPLNKNDIYTDWKLISKSPQELKVLVVAIPKNILDSLKSAFEKANLVPISFEPTASALSRTINPDSKPIVIIELNNQGCAATAIINGISTLTTTATFLSSDKPENVLLEITNSIKRILNHIKENYPESSPVSIYLTGEKASTTLSQVISQQINFPINLLNLQNVTPPYQIAYAAASSSIAPPISETSINLLPTSLQLLYQNRLNLEFIQGLKSKSLIFLILNIILITVNFSLLIYKHNEITKNYQNLDIIKPVPGSDSNLIKLQSDRLITLFSKKVTPEKDLTLFFSTLPIEITVSSLSHDISKNQIILNGFAAKRQYLIDYRDELLKSDQVKSIHLPLSSLENEDNINFSMEIILVPRGGQQP